MVLQLRLRNICPTLCSANFSLIQKLLFSSQELPERILTFGVTFRIRSTLKMKLYDLEFNLGRALQNSRMQRHLGCWQRGAGSPLC